ncbi:hypothetical protein IKL64_00780 [bacterium]|nr:hypothetical protein [bacterium]
MKKKIILSLLCLILVLLFSYAPFWGFSVLALPLMVFVDICNLFLPIIALVVFVLSLRAFFVKDFAKFNNIVGILTLIMLVTIMNIFIEAVKLQFVAVLFLIPLFIAYWIYRKKDIRLYLLVFSAILAVIIPIMCLWYRAVV